MVYHTTGMNCENLNDPTNGGVTFTPTLNSQAHYTCIDGYCLNGNRYRTCQCGGNWTGTQPTCGKQANLCLFVCLFVCLFLVDLDSAI